MSRSKSDGNIVHATIMINNAVYAEGAMLLGDTTSFGKIPKPKPISKKNK